MKYKIALYIPGLLRNFEITYPYFKKYVIDDINPDIFISCYPNKMGLEYCESMITKLYNPKKYIIRNYSEKLKQKICSNYEKYYYNKAPETSNSTVDGIISLMYNNKLCDNMRLKYEYDNNIQYDIIIKTRPDLYYIKYHDPIELSNANNGDILIPRAWDFTCHNKAAKSDICAITNRENMTKYCSLYDYFDQYFEEGIIFHPETLFGVHIDKMGINRTGVDGTGWLSAENPITNIDDRKQF